MVPCRGFTLARVFWYRKIALNLFLIFHYHPAPGSRSLNCAPTQTTYDNDYLNAEIARSKLLRANIPNNSGWWLILIPSSRVLRTTS